MYPPKDTIHAGDTVHMSAFITDTTGKARPDLGMKISWKLSPPGTGSYLRDSLYPDSTNTFHAVEAYHWYTISATYVDSSGIVLKDSVMVYVLPGAPATLTIEQSSNNMVRLPANQARLGATVLASGVLNKSVYAVLRDAFGNWYGDATDQTLQWTSQFNAVATVQKGNVSIGEGVITRQAAGTPSTNIYAALNGMKDSLFVTLGTMTYSKINIVVRDSVRDSITSLTMRTDQDTTLYAVGLRGDGSGIWDTLQVTWASAGLSISGSAPPSSNKWAVQPSAVGTGTISISYQSLHDAINVTFNYGLPQSLVLYPQTGTPDIGANTAYPQSMNVTAGQPLPLVAKIFSDNQLTREWLSQYENGTAPITWSITELTPGAHNSGTLQTTNGAITSFTGTKAPNIVKVAATFFNPAVNPLPFSDSIYIRIFPAAPAKLVIENDTNGRYNDSAFARRAGTVTIGGTSTADSVYAVLRDTYGNFVSFSTVTTWLSRDTAQVKASNGIAAYGQGIAVRQINSGQAWVIAQDGIYSGLQDSVLVKLSNVSYTALRIVVRDSTHISNLAMTIDQDTLLKVQGLRSDGGGWDSIPANWSISANLTATPNPGFSKTWRFTPTDTGSGYIKVTLAGATPDSVRVQFSHGIPRYVVLYPAAGNPATMQPYPAPVSAIPDSAGISLPAVAKVFDKAGTWLSEYEISSSPVTWTVIELPSNLSTPTGTLNPTTGYRTGFTPTKAYNSVYVVGAFTQAGVTLMDTVQVRVVPGTATQLFIEASPDSAAIQTRRIASGPPA